MSSNVILIPVLQLVAFFYFCKVRITQWRKKDFTDHGMPQASRSNPTIGGFSVQANRASCVLVRQKVFCPTRTNLPAQRGGGIRSKVADSGREKNEMITLKRENTMIRPFGDKMPGGYRHDSLYRYDNLPFFKYDGNIVPSSGRETSPSYLMRRLFCSDNKAGICHPYRAMSHEPDKPLKRRNSENIKTIINPQFESL